jgi:hypothetical protein
VYASNLRVERKFWDVRLGLNRTAFHPGNHVFSRIENFGTLSPIYGEEFRLQRLTDAGWQKIEIPGRDGWLLWAGSVFPGMSGACNSLALPRKFPSGDYRIIKEVERGSTHSAENLYLTAPFTVSGRTASRSDPLLPLPKPRSPLPAG